MIGKTPKEHQMFIFKVALESIIDVDHELVLLSEHIDRESVESEFAEYYCADNGRPSVPIRKMLGMILLKNINNLSDEGVMARLMENPYMHYFTVEKVFQKRPPKNPTDMTKFRKRVGENGAEKIFKISLMVNAKEITAKEMKLVMIDSTMQEKNITSPTDAKFHRKIIAKVLKMSRKEDIELRRTYTHELKALKLKVRFMNHPTRLKEGKKAIKRIRTIARAMVNDVARKKFCKRAGIDPVIGHLKSDHWMMRNYLKGTLGDAINTLMAAAAYDMRHWMNKNALSSLVSWLKTLFRSLGNVLFGNERHSACCTQLSRRSHGGALACLTSYY